MGGIVRFLRPLALIGALARARVYGLGEVIEPSSEGLNIAAEILDFVTKGGERRQLMADGFELRGEYRIQSSCGRLRPGCRFSRATRFLGCLLRCRFLWSRCWAAALGSRPASLLCPAVAGHSALLLSGISCS